jgi:hypothetical protein
MKRLIAAGLAGLLVLSTAGLSGCGSDNKTVIPAKQMELPKEGPTPVGGGGGKGKVNPPDNGGKPAPSDQ